MYRDPFQSTPADLQGEHILDLVTDGLVTVAIAENANELIESSIGWYDRIVHALDSEDVRPMTHPVMHAAWDAARERLSDVVPADQVPQAVARMTHFQQMIHAALATSPSPDADHESVD